MITAKSDSADTLARTDARSFDVEAIRRDFPILEQTVNGKPLVYLDNAATTQKPRAVIDAITEHYLKDNANIHRGVHELSVRATAAYEKVRAKVRDFIGADRVEEIVFLRIKKATKDGIIILNA